MASRVSGTFTGTGDSEFVVGKLVAVDLTFSGVATVNVQWLVDGTNWRTLASYTGSAQFIVEAPGIPIRLNCSAYTNDVAYGLAAAGL